jgi:hypothetical protein
VGRLCLLLLQDPATLLQRTFRGPEATVEHDDDRHPTLGQSGRDHEAVAPLESAEGEAMLGRLRDRSGRGPGRHGREDRGEGGEDEQHEPTHSTSLAEECERAVVAR